MTKKSGQKNLAGRLTVLAGWLGANGAALTVLRYTSGWLNRRKNKFIRQVRPRVHTLLYRCPGCQCEAQMESSGAWLHCGACGRRWFLKRSGRIYGLRGKTEFCSVAAWTAWERECVREEIRRGEYYFEDIVQVETLDTKGHFRDRGSGRLIQTPAALRLEWRFGGEDYTLIRRAGTLERLYASQEPERAGNCIELPVLHDRFRCSLSKQNTATKLVYAAEEIYRLARSG